MAETWPWPHFSHEEMACSCCGECEVEVLLMMRLETLRYALGQPLTVTSGYRCPAHNTAVSTTGEDGPHTTGLAVDLQADGQLTYEIIAIAPALGFTGIGVGAGFVHLDLIQGQPRPNVWTYA